jgi:hypothetical protein
MYGINGVAASYYNVKQQAPEASNGGTGIDSSDSTSVTVLTDEALLIGGTSSDTLTSANLTERKNVTGANGYIIHGGKDDKVPLKHSAILSKMSGLPLYVFPDCDHVNILKHKDDISGGLEAKNIDELIEALPDWNEKSPTPEELDKQYYISTIL